MLDIKKQAINEILGGIRTKLNILPYSDKTDLGRARLTALKIEILNSHSDPKEGKRRWEIIENTWDIYNEKYKKLEKLIANDKELQLWLSNRDF